GPYAAVIPLFVKAALENEAASINGDGETGRDFTFVENVVQANIKALFAPIKTHEVVNVACGAMTTLNDLWKLISENIGVNIEAKHAPQRVGDIKHSLASIEKASRLFGYEPYIQMKDGLKETIEWSKKNEML